MKISDNAPSEKAQADRRVAAPQPKVKDEAGDEVQVERRQDLDNGGKRNTLAVA